MKVEAYGDLAAAASKLAISLDRCQARNVTVNNIEQNTWLAQTEVI